MPTIELTKEVLVCMICGIPGDYVVQTLTGIECEYNAERELYYIRKDVEKLSTKELTEMWYSYLGVSIL